MVDYRLAPPRVTPISFNEAWTARRGRKTTVLLPFDKHAPVDYAAWSPPHT